MSCLKGGASQHLLFYLRFKNELIEKYIETERNDLFLNKTADSSSTFAMLRGRNLLGWKDKIRAHFIDIYEQLLI